jgi:Tfp pilus assembly protein PilO
MSRNYLEAVVVLMVAAALGFFLVYPKYNEFQGIEQQKEEKIAEMKNRREYYADLGLVAADLDRYRDNFKKIDTALPDKPDAPAVMSFIQAAAMQSGLVLKGVDYVGADNMSPSALGARSALAAEQVDPAAEEASAGLQNYRVAVKLAGSYASFKNFLSAINRSSRLIAVDSVGVASVPESEGGSQSGNKSAAAGKDTGGIDKILDYEVKFLANYYQ